MRNGNASLRFSLLPHFMEDLASITNVRSSMLSCTWCAAAVLGDCFPMICLPGRRCIITFAYGDWMGHGNAFIRQCVNVCVVTWVEMANQARASLTVKPLRQPGWVDPAAMMAGRR